MNRRKPSSRHRISEAKYGLFRLNARHPAIAGLLGWVCFTFLCSLLLTRWQHKNAPAHDAGHASNVDPNPPGLWRHLSWLKLMGTPHPETALNQNSPKWANFAGSPFTSASFSSWSGLRGSGNNTTVPSVYPHLQVLERQFFDLVSAYPQLAHTYQIGQSTSWMQPIWGIRISSRPDTDKDVPAVLFTGIHHAREPIGAFLCKTLMEELLDNYGKNARYTRLLDSLEIWLVPIVNPDGYEYIIQNQLQFPWWRKNLRDNNGDGIFDPLVDGVDLNRNYDFNWDEGGDGNPASWFFRGSSAFSENEIQALRDLARRENFVMGVSYHSYGESVLYPWGNFYRAPDQELIFDIAQRCANQIGRLSGSGSYNVLPLNGRVGQSSIWMYGEFGTIDFIIETGEEYFAAPEDIPRIVKENVRGALYLMERALCGGITGHVRDRQTGKPIAAEIHVTGCDAVYVKCRHANAARGRFDRLLFPGNYTLEIRAPGYQTETINSVQVHDNRMTILNVALTKQPAETLPSTN
jgi:carboxypeptidase T